MASAHVNIEDVANFERTIQTENENLNSLASSFSSTLDRTEEDLNSQLSTLNEAMSKCSAAIVSVSAKIEELQDELESLEAELAVTPPTITVTYTDDEGNSYSVEEPNPAYIALENKIAEVESEISRMQSILDQLKSVQYKIQQQLEKVSTAIRQVGEYRSELGGRMSSLNNYADEAVRKLRNIQDALYRYRDTKIQAPDLSVYKPSQNKGSFFDSFVKNHCVNTKTFKEGKKNSQKYVLLFEQGKRGVAQGLNSIQEKQILIPFGMWDKPVIKTVQGEGLDGLFTSLANAKDGERYEVIIRFHSTDVGHAFVAFVKDGKVELFDPTYPDNKCDTYFKYVDKGDIFYCRIDNLKFREM